MESLSPNVLIPEVWPLYQTNNSTVSWTADVTLTTDPTVSVATWSEILQDENSRFSFDPCGQEADLYQTILFMNQPINSLTHRKPDVESLRTPAAAFRISCSFPIDFFAIETRQPVSLYSAET